MSTAVSTPLTTPLTAVPRGRERRRVRAEAEDVLLVSGLTAGALLVHGYHPYTEDGGLYAAGIKHLLDPALYAHSQAFVEAHLRFSIFAPVMAGLVRLTHMSLPAVLLAVHLGTIWLTLYALLLLARRCYASWAAEVGAVAMVAATLTIPVAGTSLILMDPYLTARSVALPCCVLGLVFVIDWSRAVGSARKAGSLLLAVLCLMVAASFHPLMTAYGLGEAVLLSCMLGRERRARWWGAAALCGAAIAVFGVLQAFAPAEPEGYLQIAASRYYWFLSRWQWYEILGLVAPVVILWFASRLRGRASDAARAVYRMAVLAGCTAAVAALLFAHLGSATHLVARLQPLRSFQMIYLVLLMTLGAGLGERLLKQHVWRWAGTFLVIGGLMFYVQRDTYPGSAHVELPGVAPANEWQQAFLWISRNTPRDALFALDADYTSAHGEDTQSFRAMAERSALPDYSKDGGEASITPALTAEWRVGQEAQQRLSSIADWERVARLAPLKVDWVVLERSAVTGLICPYGNGMVRVCRLR